MAHPEYGAMYCIAAESDADAATIMVCFSASCSSSFLTTAAIEDAFCPIATYIHLTPVSF